ncbi:hypothetical protein CASFOL_034887 [Castilleja foliolosa]|uniref:Ribosomal protein S3 n=1 Tax=Castilleja foliolosa TaxID=1961234 RepID=A0ABD3BTG1_9LAMI
MHKTLFLIALSFLQIQLEICKGVPLPVVQELNSSESMVEKVGDWSTAMMDSESNRRILYMQKRYISYDTLRRDMVPCDKPGASYYNCKSPGVADSYTRGCDIITRCARVADGVFFAELNELFTRELAEDGYSGVEVRVTPMRTEIIIHATRTQNVLGEKGRRIRELTSVVQKRFKFPENSVELYAVKVNNRGLCAIAQAESLRYKLLGGLAVRRACYGVLRFVMESGAKGCEVIVSGKLRAQRAKAMKFKDGYMISSGQSVNEYIDSAVRHVLLRQGVLGIKVKIMLDWDPKGKQGPTTPLPDLVTIHPPKEEFIRPASIVPTAVEKKYQVHTNTSAEDAFDVNGRAAGVEGDNQNVELDPSAYPSDEAYARALQDAEEREMAARLLALAGISETVVGEDEDDEYEDEDDDEEEEHGGHLQVTHGRRLIPTNFLMSCVICRLDYEDGDTLTVLSCKHFYHSECINNWLQINKVCPVCSAEVSTSGKS